MSKNSTKHQLTVSPNPLSDPLIFELISDFPDFQFKFGPRFSFRPPKTIIIGPREPKSSLLTLHELGHALCRHYNFHTHIDRLKKEAEAWEKAKELAKKYRVPYDQDFIEDQLDTYRDWLHTKSRCKTCGLTRYQDSSGIYHCPNCEHFHPAPPNTHAQR